jgi:hypothetical protein
MDSELRRDFLEKYSVPKVNVFEEQVFDDTSYTVCSFAFLRRHNDNNIIEFVFYPSHKSFNFILNSPSWIIGQELYLDNVSVYKIKRWVIGDKYTKPNTDIILYALDDGVENGKCIRLEITDTPYRGKMTDRTRASLIIIPSITKEKQVELVKNFNLFLKEKRDKYNSMFLCNYRESKDYARKRISFDLVYNILKRIIGEIHQK